MRGFGVANRHTHALLADHRGINQEPTYGKDPNRPHQLRIPPG